MPEVGRFDGMIASIQFEAGAKHKLPHIHVRYNEHEASYSLDGKLIVGDLPKKQNKLAERWIARHTEQLYEAWDCASNGETVKQIEE